MMFNQFVSIELRRRVISEAAPAARPASSRTGRHQRRSRVPRPLETGKHREENEDKMEEKTNTQLYAGIRAAYLDPEVRLAKALPNGNRRRPPEPLANHVVVRVAAAYALWPGDVLDLEALVLEGHGYLSKLVHGHHLLGAQVQRLGAVPKHDAQDPLHAVIDEHEGARLLSVAPHLEDLVRADRLAAEGRRGLLPSALPGAHRSVDVVEASDARLHGKVLAVGQSHLFVVQLLQAIAVLRLGRPGVALLQPRVGGVELQVLVVHTGRGGIEVAHGALHAASLEHVRAQHGVVVHQHGLVGLDEAHAAHVRCEVEDHLALLARLETVLQLAQIQLLELVADLRFVEELVALPVRDHHVEAELFKLLSEVRTLHSRASTIRVSSEVRHCISLPRRKRRACKKQAGAPKHAR
eukprot:scaffold264_cov317-Pinguiococcus_pyrenoidosus.AAC.5